jgi:pyruvate-formate lyase-activating enzyme
MLAGVAQYDTPCYSDAPMTRLEMVAVTAPVRELPPHMATAEPVDVGDGFHDEETHGLDRFRWIGASATLRFARSDEPRFLELWVLSEFHDLSQTLTCAADRQSSDYPLVNGWSPISVAVPAHADRLELRVNKIFPGGYHAADRRVLGVRVRPPLLHRDPARHALIAAQHDNWVRNTREMLDGHTALESTPVNLGIDLYGACNVKPPCVYCEWDFSKDLEGAFVDAPFTPDTLREWGPFFDKSVNLVNCSIGEPFMMKEFDDLLDAFGDGGKVLEMATNGQILTDRNIARLLGRPIDLNVSLDAGTAETYAKLRNDRFDGILHNLRRLITAKGGPFRMPYVNLVFMPMRVNVHELETFVRLCADLRVDRMVLRPLNDSPGVHLKWERAGHSYDYQKELLPFHELVQVSGRAAELCRRLGVTLSDQMDFGGRMDAQFTTWFEEGRASVAAASTLGTSVGEPVLPIQPIPPVQPAAPIQPVQPKEEPLPSLGQERKPACTEPWKSLYILRRGVLPCCYGGEPIAPMDQYREAWNGPLLQAIRSDLKDGRFHTYCLKSPACPIIRKSAESHELPAKQRARLRLSRWKAHLDYVTGGAIVKVLYTAQWLGIRVRRAATDPQYVAHHVRRLLGDVSRGSLPRSDAR